jgi:hypothetical protein
VTQKPHTAKSGIRIRKKTLLRKIDWLKLMAVIPFILVILRGVPEILLE